MGAGSDSRLRWRVGSIRSDAERIGAHALFAAVGGRVALQLGEVTAAVGMQAAGMDVFSAFDAWFPGPLEMQDFEPARCFFRREPQSVHPAHLFAMSARDLAPGGSV